MAILSLAPAKCSGADDGNEPISISATSSAGAQAIHQAVAGANDWDEVNLAIWNEGAATVTLTLEIGDAAKTRTLPVRPRDPQRIEETFWLNNGKTLKAFAGAADKIMIHAIVAAHRS